MQTRVLSSRFKSRNKREIMLINSLQTEFGRFLPSNPKFSKTITFMWMRASLVQALLVGDAAVFHVAGSFCAATAKMHSSGRSINAKANSKDQR
jgi:hypothetical protein